MRGVTDEEHALLVALLRSDEYAVRLSKNLVPVQSALAARGLVEDDDGDGWGATVSPLGRRALSLWPANRVG